jgi:hypothetical protein
MNVEIIIARRPVLSNDCSGGWFGLYLRVRSSARWAQHEVIADRCSSWQIATDKASVNLR